MSKLASVLMYLYSQHVVCCGSKLSKISRHSPGAHDAIRIVEALYTVEQLTR